jgi:hypothetical protein
MAKVIVVQLATEEDAAEVQSRIAEAEEGGDLREPFNLWALEELSDIPKQIRQVREATDETVSIAGCRWTHVECG